MSQQPLPKGCHDIKTAAQLLGISEKSLYRELRRISWLHTGNYKHDPLHNTPKHWVKTAGFATTTQRGYAAPYNKNIAIIYNVTLITERGFKELEKMQKTIDTPIIKPLTPENALRAQAEKQATTHNEEREKCLEDLRQMGFFGKAN